MEREDYIIEQNKKKVESQFWIDTYGKVHKYKGEINTRIFSIHKEIANELFPELKDASHYLQSIGWVLVGSTVYEHPICDRVPTQSQINTLDRFDLLDKLCIALNSRYHNYMENLDKFE